MKKISDILLGEWVLACRDVRLEDYADFAQYWDTPLGQMKNEVLGLNITRLEIIEPHHQPPTRRFFHACNDLQ